MKRQSWMLGRGSGQLSYTGGSEKGSGICAVEGSEGVRVSIPGRVRRSQRMQLTAEWETTGASLEGPGRGVCCGITQGWSPSKHNRNGYAVY